jgi:hypothetical protein
MGNLGKQTKAEVERGNEESKKAKGKGVMVTEEEVQVSEDGREEVQVLEDGQDTKRLKLKQNNAGQKEDDERNIVMSGGFVDLSPTALTTAGSDDETLSMELTTTQDPSIDTRSPYRYGSPLLPALPVRTSCDQVLKALSASSPHMSEFRRILTSHNVAVSDIEVAHRFHTGTPIGKTTLTFLVSSNVSSNVSCKAKWESAILALRPYISEQGLTLVIEVIDSRIVNGIYTLPIVTTDPLTSFIAKKKHGIVKLLNECGAEWSSLELWDRGLGKKRKECKPTVLVGMLEPEKAVWEEVARKVKEKVGAKMEVEVCFRVLGKVQ